MKEAQRFPADFDGIIAGAPGLDWTGRAAQAVRVAKALERSEAARLLRPQRELLHKAVVDACDAIDGVKDGLIANPDALHIRSGRRCSARRPRDGACLTPAQVETARLIYSSPKNPKTGREITGLARGSELGWTDSDGPRRRERPDSINSGSSSFADPKWTVAQFNFDSDIVRAEETDADTINALDPNLKPFLDRGGKLIQYHGWSDPQISPGNSTQYYTRVAGGDGRRDQGDGVVSALHGAGDGALRRRRRAEHVRHGRRARAMGRAAAERRIRSLATHSTNDESIARARLCPYPQIAALQGNRKHRRCGQLRVPR